MQMQTLASQLSQMRILIENSFFYCISPVLEMAENEEIFCTVAPVITHRHSNEPTRFEQQR
jgi:hypothetical protein